MQSADPEWGTGTGLLPADVNSSQVLLQVPDVMNFSGAFQLSRQLAKFSPNGSYIASCSEYRLVIRDTKTLQILNLHTCLDTVMFLEWSGDSLLVMCGLFKRGLIQVWSIEQPKWTCKIDGGSAGLVSCLWAPDSRHILTTAEFNLQTTLWSLVDKSVSHIKYTKFTQGGIDFSMDGKYMALAERRDCKDSVSLFDCTQWQLVRHFDVDTNDLAGLAWSPDGKALCVWDSILDYKVLLYNMDGNCIAVYSAYDSALGIKSVMWSPSSQFLAIGSYDQKVRVLNHITWKPVAEHSHPSTVDTASAVIYTEVENKAPHSSSGTTGAAASFPQHSRYETTNLPVSIPCLKPDPEKPNPKLGVGAVRFSPDCKYMATKNDSAPSAVWVWDVAGLKLAVLLLQLNAVTDFKWDPLSSRLAVCTNNHRLYLWSPAGCVSVNVPAEPAFCVQRLSWHPDGTALILSGRGQFCVCYVSEEPALRA